MIKLLILILSINTLYAKDIYYYQNNHTVYLKQIENLNRDINGLKYETENNIILSVKNQIIVKFIKISNFEKYIKEYNLILIKQLDRNLYLFKVNNENNIFEIVNHLHNKDDIKYAQPDFIKERYLR